MAQFMGVPGPSQDEFNALSDQVTALNSKLTIATTITDLNSAIMPGLYKSYPGATNQPYNDYNIIRVYQFNEAGNDIAQEVTCVNNNKKFFRTRKNGSTWMPWKEVAENSKTIKETGTTLSASNVTSDTYVLGLEPGVYKLAGNKSNYLPTRYGVLIKFNSGASYGTCVVFSTEGGVMYFRSFYDEGWHTNNWFSLTGTSV